MATTLQIDHDDELAMQQFHNADHYQDHDGVTPYKEWYEFATPEQAKAVTQTQPVLSQPQTTSVPANGSPGVPLSSFLK